MSKKLRYVLMGVLSIILLVSVCMIVSRLLDYREGDVAYGEAENLVNLPDLSGLPDPSLPEVTLGPDPGPGQETPADDPDASGSPEASRTPYVDPYADALSSMDFTALREVNSEVRGWIIIPNTPISYPLLQADDNEYYLNRTWRKSRSSVGAIFLECQSSGDFTDFNTIIYGHRMANNSMFHSLASYSNTSYWLAHPNVYITDDYGAHTYQIFAAYEAEVPSTSYMLGSPNDATRQEFIDYCLEHSVIDTGVVPTVDDYIVTLSTCTAVGDSTRWVVHAVFRGGALPGGLEPEPEPEPSQEPGAEQSAAPGTEPGQEPDAQDSQPPEDSQTPAPDETETGGESQESGGEDAPSDSPEETEGQEGGQPPEESGEPGPVETAASEEPSEPVGTPSPSSDPEPEPSEQWER